MTLGRQHLEERPAPANGADRVRRSHCEVVQEILAVCEARNTKTLIMHEANLSHAVMQRYLEQLAERALIEHVDDERGFALTSRGEELLGLLRRAHQLLGTTPANGHVHGRP